jgi:hypothetical protein
MTQQVERRASCHCGQLRLVLAGDPPFVSACHCQACQRRSGAVFGAAGFFSRSQLLSMTGEHHAYRRQGDSGGWLVFNFCPTCGSNVFWENERMPDMIAVAVGAFADPSFPAPTRTVWTESKHEWLAFPAAIPAYPQSSI